MAYRFQLKGDNKERLEAVIENIPEGNIFAGECDKEGLKALEEVSKEKGRTLTASEGNQSIFFTVK